MFKIRITWNKANAAVADKAPFEAFVKRTEVAAMLAKALFAYPNNEIKMISVSAAVVDVLLDAPQDQQSLEAAGKKDR